MKVTAADLAALAARLGPMDTDTVRGMYRKRDPRIANVDRVVDIDKRYRWDLFYAAQGHRVLTGDYTDSHIDTALRRIVAPLGVQR